MEPTYVTGVLLVEKVAGAIRNDHTTGPQNRADGVRQAHHASLPAFLFRFAGTRGVKGRWYTAVLRPVATASIVSSSREDMRYLGTCCIQGTVPLNG